MNIDMLPFYVMAAFAGAFIGWNVKNLFACILIAACVGGFIVGVLPKLLGVN